MASPSQITRYLASESFVPEEPRDKHGPLNIIFLFDVGDTLAIKKGTQFRVFPYARLLRQRGHKVYFLVPEWSYNAAVLQQLADRGDIDGFSCLKAYVAQGAVNAMSRMFIHPAIRNKVRRRQQRDSLVSLLESIERWQCDVIVHNQRMYFFAIPELQKYTAVVIDWADSFALYWWREVSWSVRRRQIGKLGHAIRMLVSNAAEESYYPRVADASVVVSPVDKSVIDRLCGSPERVYLVPNGISLPKNSRLPRDPDRIIFTGWMNYPPNTEAALWFLDDVFPLILKARPATRFVIAGAEPEPELLARASASVIVTGAVPDLSQEIARSSVYVAPLVSGVGFKTKVFEAFATGTYVVGTEFAAEFLPPDLRECVTVARGAVPLANAVVRALSDPEALRTSVERAQEILRREHTCEGRTLQLESVFRAAMSNRKDGLKVHSE